MGSDGGPAFPFYETSDPGERPGMSLRDYFARGAMEALIATPEGRHARASVVADCAYDYADAMLAQRAKGGG